MESTSLLNISLLAFAMVFLILAVLSLLMRLVIVVFPEKKTRIDAATMAALTAALNNIFPGMKITEVEEEK
ncbi:MAG: hypothetical protein R6V02_02835 [Candidatus Aminicenantes bacterium]